MDKKYGEFVGVDSIYTAIITEDSETAYTAETPEYFAPAAEIAGEPEIESGSSVRKKNPFIRKAVNRSKKKALEAMQKKFDEKIELNIE